MKNKQHNSLCVGIDLGTTNSVVAIVNELPNGKLVPKVLDLPRSVDSYNCAGIAKFTSKRANTLPSCVWYKEQNNYEPVVGDFAKKQYALRPHLVAKSIKSQMGNPLVQSLSEYIPDKTPAEVSARILQHMLRETSRFYGQEITDAVITVPANFDATMCRATRDAAKLAGIDITESDGRERPLLLPEPNAVLYDFINQVQNGEIPNQILDLTTHKYVLVFDLGGGTLDITLHKISQDENAILHVEEIATNRYTLLGGDHFDQTLAEAMYRRYLAQYKNYADVVEQLKQNKRLFFPQLMTYAEELKFEANDRFGREIQNTDFWGNSEYPEEINVGGNIHGTGYSYDDTFSKAEIEDILSVWMGNELVFNDFQRLHEISNTQNIIYPILDVLHKASKKLGTAINIDAVLLNGGMSKFYMVQQRLKQFFGFEPCITTDPDLAVAKGAAIYHHYLHKYAEMKQSMRLVGKEEQQQEKYCITAARPLVQWENNILNDALYLGLKNQSVHELIPTGASLPYTSEIMNGFQIFPKQQQIQIPIKSQNLDGSYRKIACGNILFQKSYPKCVYVSFQIHMNTNKVISMTAWTSTDIDGKHRLEECVATIEIDTKEKTNEKSKFIPQAGSILQPDAEISSLLQLCQNVDTSHKKRMIPKGDTLEKISALVKNIKSAGNPEAFADTVLSSFDKQIGEFAKQRLFVIARALAPKWTDTAKSKLANICMQQLHPELYGFSASGERVNTNKAAIYTCGVCMKKHQIMQLQPLTNNPKYTDALLYTYAKLQTQTAWIITEFEKDQKNYFLQKSNQLQNSVYALGIGLCPNNDAKDRLVSEAVERKMVNQICALIESGSLQSTELTACILALGWICDQRTLPCTAKNTQKALYTLQHMDSWYEADMILYSTKSCSIASKMIQGYALEDDEEAFLLTKVED